RAAGPRHGLARHRHAREPAAGVQLRGDARGAAGAEDRLPGGDRLPPGLDRRRRARTAGRPAAVERLRPQPAGAAADGVAAELAPWRRLGSRLALWAAALATGGRPPWRRGALGPDPEQAL